MYQYCLKFNLSEWVENFRSPKQYTYKKLKQNKFDRFFYQDISADYCQQFLLFSRTRNEE